MNGATEKFLRSPGVEERTVDRTAVLAKPEKHLYFAVNRVGTRIWTLLEQPRTVAELARVLTTEFAVEENVCRRQTEEFLQKLMNMELVTRLD